MFRSWEYQVRTTARFLPVHYFGTVVLFGVVGKCFLSDDPIARLLKLKIQLELEDRLWVPCGLSSIPVYLN